MSTAQDPGGHLVEQRLKQVMVGPVHHRDLDLRAPQRTGGEQAAEAAAHDRDPMPAPVRSAGSSHDHASQRTSLRSFTVIA
jgi:hypothetical protein